jgi:sugar lactone lactonase YvrE
VALDRFGNLWVADGGNNRVLRFPKKNGLISTNADLVLGQPLKQDNSPDFTVGPNSTGTELNRMNGPSSLTFGPDDSLYVADTGLTYPTSNKRILIFTPNIVNGEPVFSNGMFATQSVGVVDKPYITGVMNPNNPAYDGLWVNEGTDGETIKTLAHYDWNLNFIHVFSQLKTRSASVVGIDKFGNILAPIGRDVHDIQVFNPPYTFPFPANFSNTFLLPPQNQMNAVTNRRLQEVYGIATAKNQLYVADLCRILIWNNLADLTDGAAATSIIGQLSFESNAKVGSGGCAYNIKVDGNDRLWAASASRILVYDTPLYTWSRPLKVIEGPIPVLGGGSIDIGDNYAYGLAPTRDGSAVWVSQPPLNRVLRIKNPLSDSPFSAINPDGYRVDVVLGQSTLSGTLCNQDNNPPQVFDQTTRVIADKNKLCRPDRLAVDSNNNLFVSDHQAEGAGNLRVLMFSASDINANPSMAVYAPYASKEFPFDGAQLTQNHATYEPAFDSLDRMVVGYDADVTERAVGEPFLVGFYNYPTSSAINPDGYLNDHFVYPFSIAFDAFDNLYVGDSNHAQILIYKNPFNNTPTATPGPQRPSMTTVTAHITQSGDDAYTKCGVTTVAGAELGIGYDGVCSFTAGLRFSNIDVPKGAVIDNAEIVFLPINPRTNAVNLKINGAAQVDAATFTGNTNLTSLPKITKVVTVNGVSSNVPYDIPYNISEKWSREFYEPSPNLKAIVQAIIDQSGWAINLDSRTMVFLIDNNGSTTFRDFTAADYNSAGDGAYLFIQYH